MSTVGAFVKSKMHNMAVWVQAELGADAKMDYVAAIDARLELELTTFAAMCHSKRDIYDRRDWDAMVALAVEQPGFEPVVQLLNDVKAREHMHEKFWRYVKLFIEVME